MYYRYKFKSYVYRILTCEDYPTDACSNSCADVDVYTRYAQPLGIIYQNRSARVQNNF